MKPSQPCTLLELVQTVDRYTKVVTHWSAWL